MQRAARTAVLALLLLLAGCFSPETLRPTDAAFDGSMETPKGGKTLAYAQPPEAVFQAALRVLPRLSLVVARIAPDHSYILAEHGMSMMSNGENVGVYIKALGAGSAVTVISEKKTPTNLFAPDHTDPVHASLGAELGRAGLPPAAMPPVPVAPAKPGRTKQAPAAQPPAPGPDGVVI